MAELNKQKIVLKKNYTHIFHTMTLGLSDNFR